MTCPPEKVMVFWKQRALKCPVTTELIAHQLEDYMEALRNILLIHQNLVNREYVCFVAHACALQQFYVYSQL